MFTYLRVFDFISFQIQAQICIYASSFVEVKFM